MIKSGVLNNIQILRGLSAILVVAYHIIGVSEKYGHESLSVFKFVELYGEFGVDVFFVISGFVMFRATAKKNITAVNFVINRIARILPSYWAVTISAYVIYLLIPGLGGDGAPNALNLFASLFFVSNLFLNKFPIVYVGWTLEYEVFFYFLISVGLVLLKNRVAYVVSFFIFLMVVLGVWSALILEFSAGVLLGGLLSNNKIGDLNKFFIVVALCVIVKVVSLVGDYSGRFFMFGAPAFFLVFLCGILNQVNSRIFVFFGDSSFAIYLLQFFTIPFLYKASSGFLVNGYFLAGFVLLFTIFSGGAYWYFFEQPFSRWCLTKMHVFFRTE